jgi:hypothetical protein
VLSRPAAAEALPTYVPPTDTSGVPKPAGAIRCRFDHSASGWNGAQDCQPATTLAAADHGHLRKNSTTWDSGWVRSVNEVAIPKLPPPPPRHAQNRSLFVRASQVLTIPSAVTICTDTRLSLVSP